MVVLSSGLLKRPTECHAPVLSLTKGLSWRTMLHASLFMLHAHRLTCA